jgi:ferrochelatase
MRYWHPFADETAKRVAAFAPDRIVLLPLYPHFSGTTTGSSLKDWYRAAAIAGVTAPTLEIRDYHDHPGYVGALAAQLRIGLFEARAKGPFRLLFSAHGLPKKVITAGDPYQAQIERTAAAVVAALGDDGQGLDWQVCYQSRVGPLEWIGPSTEDEIKRAGKASLGLVVVPIAFVSEHSETLVELDIEYRELAIHQGVPFYIRVPALGTDANFIAALTDLTRASLEAA